MAPPASAYPTQHGRRRRRTDPHLGGSVLRTASVALAAYGTYRLAAWAYNSWLGDGDGDDRVREERHSDGVGEVSATSVSRRSRGESAGGTRAERCRIETLRAVEDFLPSLRKAVEGRTDCAAEGRELKQIRRRRRQKRDEEESKPPPQARGDGDGGGISPPSAQRHREKRDKDGGERGVGGDGGNEADEGGVVEYDDDDEEEEKRLWEIIKVRSITRLVSTAYAHAALLCLLTVQVHVMGRMLLEDEEGASGDGPLPANGGSSAEEIMGQYHKSHRLVLTRTFQHFFSDEGVGGLVRAVEEAVRNRLSAWNMTDPKLALCEEEFAAGLDAVRWSFESDRGAGNDYSFWGEFLVPDPASAADDEARGHPRDGGGEERARLVLDETWDAVESPLFASALRECVEGTFDVMRREYWGKTLFSSTSLNGEETSVANGETNGNGLSIRRRGGGRRVPQPKLPLATIVTQLKHSSNSVYCTKGGGPSGGDLVVGDRRPNGANHSENMYLSVSFMRGCPSLRELGYACFYDNEQT